ncbi:FAD-binding oxidoreductase [Pseudarthrobacter phenanthrenivorans]|uniref:NAD(P)/FAD-dependent oxidoreductase n=1 Tax=Pseudarthrobacter phenanthrenivorans TaxID=361575 RepID=UPI0011264892|nr:FAD-binding oxidoreductase [Pseudarthrobacter phenanthrenivorans]TPV51108.1 FAD-binding oxidoreductase [Pseudarthrobacter phenanthrenivorans]
MKQRIAVIGAGVVGSAVFERLAKEGHEVTLYDRSAPGSGSSAASFAWINANNKVPETYFELNREAMEEHVRRRNEGSRAFYQTGYYELATAEEHVNRLQSKVSRLADWGYDVQVLDNAAARQALPVFAPAAIGSFNAFFPHEGYCDIPRFIAECIDDGRRNGGHFVLDEVMEVEAKTGSRIIHLKRGPKQAYDIVVLAVGRWTQKVSQTCGITVPMSDAVAVGAPNLGFLAVTEPAPVLSDSVVTTSTLSLRPEGHGRLMLQALQLDVQADPSREYSRTGPIAQEFNQYLSNCLNTGFPVSVEAVKVGYRPLSLDGLTIAGFADTAATLYVIATHSGVTLAPLLARFAAAEVGGKEVPALGPFRPSRFNSSMERTVPAPAARAAGDQ